MPAQPQTCCPAFPLNELQDQDQEVKECAISCMASAVAALGDALGADVAQVEGAYPAHAVAAAVPLLVVNLFVASGLFSRPGAEGERASDQGAATASPSWPQVGALADEFAELPPRAAGRAKKRAKTEHKKSPGGKAAPPPQQQAASGGPEVGGRRLAAAAAAATAAVVLVFCLFAAARLEPLLSCTSCCPELLYMCNCG